MHDLISRRQAVDALTERFKRVPTNAIIAKDVIKNLPSIQPDTTTHDSIPAETGKNDGDRTSGDCISRQQATCEYCHEDSDGYVLSIEKNGHAYIQNGKLALRANGWWGECGIDYCPMCGRRLTYG